MRKLLRHMILCISSHKQCFFVTLILTVLADMSFSVQAQQEAMYSQYMFNMVHINPAFAGNRVQDNITVLYRNQWMGMKGAPKTGTASWDRRADESNVGYGLELYNDQLGIEKTSGFQAFYSYHIPFEKAYLALGVSGGVLNYKALYSESILFQGGDDIFQKDVSGWLPTAGFGLYFATENWYVGLSVPALLHTKINVQQSLSQNVFGASNHYFLAGAYMFPVSETFKLKPSVLLKAVKGSPLQFDINALGWINDVVGIGASYRHQDAMVAMFQLQINRSLRIGYAYDYTISDFKAYSKGSHEIMLRIEIPPANCISCQQERNIHD